MRAGEEDLRAARLLPHIVDVGAHAVAVAEALARDQLVAAQQGLGPTEVDHEVAVFRPLHHAVDDLAAAILELSELALAFIFTDELDDDLLRRLRRDAAEIDRRQWVDDELAEADLRLEFPRDMQRNLSVLVFGGFDDLGPAGEPDIAGLAVDRRANVLLMAILGATRFLDRLLHGFQNLVAVDRFLARDGIGN